MAKTPKKESTIPKAHKETDSKDGGVFFFAQATNKYINAKTNVDILKIFPAIEPLSKKGNELEITHNARKMVKKIEKERCILLASFLIVLLLLFFSNFK